MLIITKCDPVLLALSSGLAAETAKPREVRVSVCVHVCGCISVCVRVQCVHPRLRAFLNHDTIGCSGVRDKIKTILYRCLPYCHCLKTWAGMDTHTQKHTHRHTQWETRLFHSPNQTPSATLPTRHTKFCTGISHHSIFLWPFACPRSLTLWLWNWLSRKVWKCSVVQHKIQHVDCGFRQNVNCRCLVGLR